MLSTGTISSAREGGEEGGWRKGAEEGVVLGLRLNQKINFTYLAELLFCCCCCCCCCLLRLQSWRLEKKMPLQIWDRDPQEPSGSIVLTAGLNAIDLADSMIDPSFHLTAERHRCRESLTDLAEEWLAPALPAWHRSWVDRLRELGPKNWLSPVLPVWHHSCR